VTDSRPRAHLGPPLANGSSAHAAPVAQTIRDILEAVASAPLADAILREAIASSGLGSVPREASRLAPMVRVELADIARRALGAEAAAAVGARLEPLLAAISALERRDPDRAPGTAPAPATSSVSPGAADVLARGLRPFRIVLLIGTDARHSAELDSIVARPTSIIPVQDGRALASALAMLRDQPRMIVVECRRSAQPLLPLLSVDPPLLDDALVLLWGANDAQKRTTIDRFPGAQIVDLHDETTSSEDIAVVVKAAKAGRS
jgi:hypothetical protein